MASLIRDAKLREEVIAIEKSYQEALYTTCIEQSALTEHHASQLLDSIVPKVDARFAGGSKPLEYVAWQLAMHRSVLATHMLGLPYSDSVRFRMLTPVVQESPITRVSLIGTARYSQSTGHRAR